MNRQQIGVMLTLRGLGLNLKMDSFDDRLIIQKAIYLAQAGGINLGYFYHWYLHGPYCPSLTRDLYAADIDVKAEMDDSARWVLDESSQGKLNGLKTFLKTSGEKNGSTLRRRLELLASVHFLIDREQVPKTENETIIKDRLRAFGKEFKEEDVLKALRGLKENDLIRS